MIFENLKSDLISKVSVRKYCMKEMKRKNAKVF